MKSALIEITNRCNLRCKHCFNNSGGKSNDDMELSALISIIEQLEKLKVEKITFTGGEPLLYSQFNELLDFISTSSTRFIFNTNGTIICPRLMALQAQKTNVYFQVSLDGASSKTNDYIRGIGSFEKTIHFLKESVPQRTTIKVTLNRNNMYQLKDFFELAFSLKIIPRFGYIFNSGRASENWGDLGLSNADILLLVKKLEKYALEYEFDVRNYRLGIFHQCPINNNQIPTEIFIDYVGNIYPCGMLTKRAFLLGNIYSSTLKNIVSNKNSQYATIRQLLLQRQKLFGLQFCNKCLVAKTGFCPLDGGCLGSDLNMCFEEGSTCLLKKNYIIYHGLQGYLLKTEDNKCCTN